MIPVFCSVEALMFQIVDHYLKFDLQLVWLDANGILVFVEDMWLPVPVN